MSVIQLLFVERDGAHVIVDGVLVADATVPTAERPTGPSPPPNTPVTLRLRLPENAEWRSRLAALLDHWARTSQTVQVELHPNRMKTVAEVVCQRSTLRLDVVEAVS